MFKKIALLLLLSVLLINQAQANVNGQYYPPVDSDYYLTKFSWELYVPLGATKVKMIQQDENGELTNKVVTWSAEPNTFVWVDFYCRDGVAIQYLNDDLEIVDSHMRGKTTVHLNEETCGDNFVQPSNYIEAERKYAGDTFGEGAAPDPINQPGDGSGGTGEGGLSEDPGTGGSDGGGDDGSGGSGGDGTGGSDGSTDYSDFFESPGWKEHMDKLEEIKDAIPPPPNWEEIADTFRDSIAPQIKSDLEDLLGRAPNPPAPPPQPPADFDYGGIEAPQGQETPGLDDAGFSEQDIMDEAPQITEREDPTGGFQIDDPVDGLPSIDEFKDQAPTEGEAPLPSDPEEPPNPAPGAPDDSATAPFPSDEGATAPSPGDTGATAPTPSDEGASAPTPGESASEAPIPGGDSSTAPIPGADGSTAPVPGGDSSTAPIPGS